MREKVLVGALVLALVVTGCSGAKDSAKPADPQAGQQAPATAPPAGQSDSKDGSLPVKKESSKATYTVEETFVGQQGINKAVGTTSAFEGALDLKAGVITGGTVKVDLRTLKSNSGQRDNALTTKFLESNKYPFATFVITGMEGDALKEGAMTAVTLKGKMTIHDTEKDLAFKGEGGLTGGLVKLNLQANFKMSEFGITVPNIAGMLKAEDPVVLAIEVTAGK
ncbi:MAG TPA: YceI family protein [Symbiobacteriaceae bacterium]|nr:YceI family protein [Symbiobacteriaceae bacterium]